MISGGISLIPGADLEHQVIFIVPKLRLIAK